MTKSTLHELATASVYLEQQCGLMQGMFSKMGFHITPKLDKADIVVFGGGSDVNPILYGEDPLPGTIYDDQRDAWCMNLWRNSEDKLKIGICRGGQFLNVKNGGKLWQHEDQHGRSHQLEQEFTAEK